MNLRDLQYFAVIAEKQHLGRAAEALNLSTPALSMSLRRLEQFMETKLVKRTPKGVALTPAGEAVYAHARRLRLSVDDISREVKDLTQGLSGNLRIGTNPGFAIYLVPEACSAFMRIAPKVTLKITTLEYDLLLQALINGELDIVVLTVTQQISKDLTLEHLYEEEYVIYAASSHRLAKRKTVQISELASEHWILSGVHSGAEAGLSGAFARNHLPPPNFTVVASNAQLRQRLVAASDLLAVSPRLSVLHSGMQSKLAELRVKDLAITRRVGVLYRKDAYLPPTAQRFIEILKTTAKTLAKENR